MCRHVFERIGGGYAVGRLGEELYERLFGAQVLAVLEDLRCALVTGDRFETCEGDVLADDDFFERVGFLDQKRLGLFAVGAADFGKDSHRLLDLHLGRQVAEHSVGVGDFKGVAGLIGLNEHFFNGAVGHIHRVAPRAFAKAVPSATYIE